MGGQWEGSGWGGGQGGCEQSLKSFCENSKKKIWGGGSGGGGSVAEGFRWGGRAWWGGDQGGCKRNVGGRGDVGYGGCEPRIEGIVQCTKRYCTILRK